MAHFYDLEVGLLRNAEESRHRHHHHRHLPREACEIILATPDSSSSDADGLAFFDSQESSSSSSSSSSLSLMDRFDAPATIRKTKKRIREVVFEESVALPIKSHPRKKVKVHHHDPRKWTTTTTTTTDPLASSACRTNPQRRQQEEKKKKKDSRKIDKSARTTAVGGGNNRCSSIVAPVPSSALVSVPPNNQQLQQQHRGGGGNVDGDPLQHQQMGPAEWKPHAISEDYQVYLKTGINPKERDSQRCSTSDSGGGGSCFGCNLRGDGTPLKKKNVEVFFRRMEDVASSVPDAFSRASIIEKDYERLIREPQRKLKKALGSGKKRKRNRVTEEGTDDDDDEEEDEDMDDDEEEDEEDGWDKIDIYNHLGNHANNVVEDIDYLRRSTFKQLKLLEDCLFMEHPTKKNSFGDPLLVMNEAMARCYKDLVKSHLDICRSRPDLMVPFYDGKRTATPRTVSSGAMGSSRDIVSPSDLGGRLLYGKGL